MNIIKNTVTVPAYTNDDFSVQGKVDMVVHSHWNRDTIVEIELAGTRVFVEADALKLAIENCTRVRRR